MWTGHPADVAVPSQLAEVIVLPGGQRAVGLREQTTGLVVGADSSAQQTLALRVGAGVGLTWTGPDAETTRPEGETTQINKQNRQSSNMHALVRKGALGRSCRVDRSKNARVTAGADDGIWTPLRGYS